MTTAALAAALLFQALAAAAEPGSFLSSAESRVQPDDVLTATWQVPEAVSRDRDEMELVLSLDDGATFPIRLTARIDPESRTARWRVPALPTEHARLALRAGDDDDPASEALVAVSDPFVIATPGAGAREDLFAVADEWRTREALEGAPVRSLPREVGSPEADEFAEADSDASDSETAPAAPDAQPGKDAAPAVSAPPPTNPAPSPAPSANSPLPLRL